MHWRKTFLVAAMITTAWAGSNAKASWLIDVSGGIGDPMRSFGDFWAPGATFRLGASYLVGPQFAIGADASYLKNDTSDDYQALLDLVDPGAKDEFTFWQYGVHGKWMIPTKPESKWDPYLVVGAGLYSVKDKYDSPTFSEELSQTAFGLRGGAGVDYWMSSKFGLGLDASYHSAFTSEDKIGHSSAPYLAVTAGIRWKITTAP